MTLGPDKLTLCLRNTLKKKENKKIINKFLKGKYEWNNKELKKLKEDIRLTLRKEQENRCIYCRRIIKIERRNVYEDIEHFLDKSKPYYRKWAFTNINLTISCRACNFTKSINDLGCIALRGSVNIKQHIGNFKWLHPYFDNYHDNIEILKGWVYSVKPNAPNPVASRNLIQECKLDDIKIIESRSEEAKNKIARLLRLANRAGNAGNNARAIKLNNAALAELNKSWFDL